jgi:hypothetical protein
MSFFDILNRKSNQATTDADTDVDVTVPEQKSQDAAQSFFSCSSDSYYNRDLMENQNSIRKVKKSLEETRDTAMALHDQLSHLFAKRENILDQLNRDLVDERVKLFSEGNHEKKKDVYEECWSDLKAYITGLHLDERVVFIREQGFDHGRFSVDGRLIRFSVCIADGNVYRYGSVIGNLIGDEVCNIAASISERVCDPLKQ